MDLQNVVPIHNGVSLAAQEPEIPRPKFRKRATENVRALEERGSVPLRGFANYSSAQLAKLALAGERTASHWKKKGMAPARVVAWLELTGYGRLGMISSEWSDWALRKGKLSNSDGHEFTESEVRSIPLQHQRIAALEARIRQLAAELDRQTKLATERSREFNAIKAIGQAEAMSRAACAVLSGFMGSGDGEPPAAEGIEPVVRNAMMAVCNVTLEVIKRNRVGGSRSG